MDQEKEQSLKTGLSAIVMLVLLISAVLLTLNYFEVVPLSKTFSFLSFLPAQSRIKSGSLDTSVGGLPPRQQRSGGVRREEGTQKNVITAGNPLVVENSSAGLKYQPINNAFVNPTGELIIETELSVGQEGTGSTGIFLTNGLSNNDSDRRQLGVFYDTKIQNWLIEYKAGNKSEFRRLGVKERFVKLRMAIVPEGNSVLVNSGLENKKIYFSGSIYDSGTKMNARIQVGPNSELTINSLSYK